MQDNALKDKRPLRDLLEKASGRPDLTPLLAELPPEDHVSLQDLTDRLLNGHREWSEIEVKLFLLREYLGS